MKTGETRYLCQHCGGMVVFGHVCRREIRKLQSIISLQDEMIKNLREANEFYRSQKNWIQDQPDSMCFTYRRRISNDDVSIEEVWMREYMDNRHYGGKHAWEAHFKDQELQKKMEELL